VIVEAVYGDLLRTLPGAFSANLFGEATTPRARIAKALEDYVKEFGTRPAPGVLDTLIERSIASQPEAVREAITDEWALVQETDPDENPEFITKEVREWVSYQRTRQALMDAADALAVATSTRHARRWRRRRRPDGKPDRSRRLTRPTWCLNPSSRCRGFCDRS